MGGDFSLRRHSTSGVNGIMIAQARESGNPYPGDLSFQAVKQSGGSYKLYVIAHVYIEDYLYGESAIAVDADTGRVLFSKNSRVRMYPASTTKMMTRHRRWPPAPTPCG